MEVKYKYLKIVLCFNKYTYIILYYKHRETYLCLISFNIKKKD